MLINIPDILSIFVQIQSSEGSSDSTQYTMSPLSDPSPSIPTLRHILLIKSSVLAAGTYNVHLSERGTNKGKFLPLNEKLDKEQDLDVCICKRNS